MTETDPCVGLELDGWLGCARELATPCDTMARMAQNGRFGTSVVRRTRMRSSDLPGLRNKRYVCHSGRRKLRLEVSLWEWVHVLAREEASDGPWTV